MQPPSNRFFVQIKWKQSPEPFVYGPYDTQERAEHVRSIKTKGYREHINRGARLLDDVQEHAIFEATYNELPPN